MAELRYLHERLNGLSAEQRLREIHMMLPMAYDKALESDDGSWAQCYYDDIRFLLDLLERHHVPGM